MKVKDLLQNVNKAKEFEDEVYISDFAEKVFEIYDTHHWDSQTRLTSYYFGSWHCTDTMVGFKVYFFDDEPVAISSQLGRKQTENFEWISKETYKKVKDHILSYREVQEGEPKLIDLEAEISETYKIEFYGQMYDSHKNNAIYDNSSVRIIDNKKSFNDGVYHPETVLIETEFGEREWVEPKLLSFPYNLK